MPLFICKLAYLVRELQRLRKIVEGKGASQAFDSIKLDDFPVRDLGLKFGDLGIRHGRFVFAACDALHLR
jgi:hypothetical protein